ncbi:MAG: tetratricopeptide repeat protein [Bdellovibrionales bacterium]|nr:tetratricopeptide repeat protein [Bdellovibrionales bacterium]
MKTLAKIAGVFAVLGVLLFLKDRNANDMSDPKLIESSNVPGGSGKPRFGAGISNVQSSRSPTQLDEGPGNLQPDTRSVPVIPLTSGNFKGFVDRCFQGEHCVLDDDAWEMYQRFKRSGDLLAADNLISFLRSKLKDPEFRNKYKHLLKRMIVDFYPKEERQFQEAAYYNYLGDLQKSLDLYMDLERKVESDSTLRSASKLNIANTFYEMKRFSEALPYYEASREQYLSREQNSKVPSRNEMLDFIEERISSIKSKL